MKVRYIGDSCQINLTYGKFYDVLSIQDGMYRIIDDINEDYLFFRSDFESLPDGEFDRPLPDVSTSLNISDLKKLYAILMEYQLSSEDYVAIEKKVSEHLQTCGFDENYIPTEAGRMCESILDLLSQLMNDGTQ